MPRRGRNRKKTRTHVEDTEKAQGALATDETAKIPKSLVIRRGKCEAVVADLVQDLRRVLMPYTALNFQEDASYRKLTLQKYCKHVCLPLGVTHIIALSQNQDRLIMRIAKTPQGPTLTFRLHQFSLSKHVQRLQKRPMNINLLTSNNSPIVVTNNFGDATAPPQVKLMRITFQNMFPAINVATVRLKECRRVVLFHLVEEEVEIEKEDDKKGDEDGASNSEKDDESEAKTTKIVQRIEVRHYSIKATPVGVDRKVRRLVQAKLPNLNRVQDIADYITGSAPSMTNVDAASDSEPEDSNAVVELAQNYAGRGNKKSGTSALKLVELGPRLSLELKKVEQGLSDGAVMYHADIKKTPEEVKELKARHEQKIQLKKQRKAVQEQNVERKRKAKEDKLEAKRQRRKEREEATMTELRNEEQNESDSDDSDDESEGSAGEE